MMKKIFSLRAISGVVLLGALTGCLKDEGFDDKQYGSITGNTTGGKYITIPLVTKNPNVVPLESKNTAQSISLFSFSYDYEKAAAGGESVTVAVDNSSITGSVLPLPTAAYTIPSTTTTFKAGQVISDPFAISISTNALDPTKIYGIGFTITKVSDGIAIPSNLKTVIFNFTVKNKYHGAYTANGYFYHPTAPRTIVNRAKSVLTAGANSITVELGDLGGSGYIALITVNESNNTLTIEPAPGAAGAPYTMFTSGLPATNPGYTAAWANASQCNNTYDPATKSFRVRYGYMGGNGWRVTEEIIKKN